MIRLDFETRSRADLKEVGAFRYAEDPSTDILVVAVSKDGAPVVSWDVRESPEGNEAIALLRQALETGEEIHAFNAQFEYAVLKYVATRQFGFPPPSPDQMRCTAAVSRIAGCPPSLAKAGEFLRIQREKDKMGHPLILKFSVPQKGGGFITHGTHTEFTAGGERMTAAEAFQRFVEYCRRDVEAESDIAATLQPFALSGWLLDMFKLDMRLNDRGVPVDVQALTNAVALMDEYRERLTRRFVELTGFNPTQNARVKEWLQAEGYAGDSLNKEARADYGNDPSLSAAGAEALDIVAKLSFAAVKKIPTMLRMAMSDGRIRGAFKFYGAQKTGRWTSEGAQFQNMKKPPKRLRPIIEEAFRDVREGIDLDTFTAFYGDPYETLACMARYFIRPPGGTGVYDVDFAAVEARILPMLIGAERILDKIRRGEDLYVGLMDRILMYYPHHRDYLDRDISKPITLACQFDGGKNAVQTATGGKFNEEECAAIAKMVREENPEFQPAWRKFQESWVKALEQPRTWVRITDHVEIGYSPTKPFPRILMRLPSGRCITYPYPKAEPITMAWVERTTIVGETEHVRGGWERFKGHRTSDECYDERKRFDMDAEDEVAKAFGPSSVVKRLRVTKSFHSHELSFYGHVEGALYGRVQTRGGDLLQSCLAEGTPVLTRDSGFKPIETITPDDLVWDGDDWVPCGGVIYKGEKECRVIEGITATPDHDFVVDIYWRKCYNLSRDEIIHESRRLVRETIRKHGRHPEGGYGEEGRMVADEVRLRIGDDQAVQGSDKGHADTEEGGVRKDMPAQRHQTSKEARVVQAPASAYPRHDAGQMLPETELQLPPLRRERHQGLRAVERLSELLRGYVCRIPEGVADRQDRQQRRLHAGELPLGDVPGELSQQREDGLHGHPGWENADDDGCGEVRDQLHDAPLSQGCGGVCGGDASPSGRVKKVYDILNCGPQERFAIRTDHGLMLAHNCTQGTGVDLLANACILAEAEGLDPWLLVHDQMLTTGVGGLDVLQRCSTTVPDWFKGFPLGAEAEWKPSYCKA